MFVSETQTKSIIYKFWWLIITKFQEKLGPNSISLIAFWCFFLVNPGKFVKDTSSIFPVFHGNGLQALGCWWPVERWNGLRLSGGRFGDFGMRVNPSGMKKTKAPPKKWGSNIRDGWYHIPWTLWNPLFWGLICGLNPLNEGSYQSKQGSLGCMYVYFHISIYICITYTRIVPLPPFLQAAKFLTGRALIVSFNIQLPRSSWHAVAPRTMEGVVGWGLQGFFSP